jgi:hypothetical protein
MVFLDHSDGFLDRADGTVTGSVMVRIGCGSIYWKQLRIISLTKHKFNNFL